MSKKHKRTAGSWLVTLGRKVKHAVKPVQQPKPQKPGGVYDRLEKKIEPKPEEKKEKKIVETKKFNPDIAFFLFIFGLSLCFILYAIYIFSQLK
jgi:hypothetical protein